MDFRMSRDMERGDLISRMGNFQQVQPNSNSLQPQIYQQLPGEGNSNLLFSNKWRELVYNKTSNSLRFMGTNLTTSFSSNSSLISFSNSLIHKVSSFNNNNSSNNLSIGNLSTTSNNLEFIVKILI